MKKHEILSILDRFSDDDEIIIYDARHDMEITEISDFARHFQFIGYAESRKRLCDDDMVFVAGKFYSKSDLTQQEIDQKRREAGFLRIDHAKSIEENAKIFYRDYDLIEGNKRDIHVIIEQINDAILPYENQILDQRLRAIINRLIKDYLNRCQETGVISDYIVDGDNVLIINKFKDGFYVFPLST